MTEKTKSLTRNREWNLERLSSLLHIKRGVTKQANKAIPKDSDHFKYLCKKFLGFSQVEKRGIFVGPDILKLMKDKKSRDYHDNKGKSILSWLDPKYIFFTYMWTFPENLG
ncbi:hypothetical protein TNCV_541791 [Trichonephila clavipes]|nr:hypothetical protein TNCV_541791 [Trichonephila clavipes]